MSHEKFNLNIQMNYGWVYLSPPMPIFDSKGRITGYNHRIQDSDGRDEIMPPIIKITYND